MDGSLVTYRGKARRSSRGRFIDFLKNRNLGCITATLYFKSIGKSATIRPKSSCLNCWFLKYCTKGCSFCVKLVPINSGRNAITFPMSSSFTPASSNMNFTYMPSPQSDALTTDRATATLIVYSGWKYCGPKTMGFPVKSSRRLLANTLSITSRIKSRIE